MVKGGAKGIKNNSEWDIEQFPTRKTRRLGNKRRRAAARKEIRLANPAGE